MITTQSFLWDVFKAATTTHVLPPFPNSITALSTPLLDIGQPQLNRCIPSSYATSWLCPSLPTSMTTDDSPQDITN